MNDTETALQQFSSLAVVIADDDEGPVRVQLIDGVARQTPGAADDEVLRHLLNDTFSFQQRIGLLAGRRYVTRGQPLPQRNPRFFAGSTAAVQLHGRDTARRGHRQHDLAFLQNSITAWRILEMSVLAPDTDHAGLETLSEGKLAQLFAQPRRVIPQVELRNLEARTLLE